MAANMRRRQYINREREREREKRETANPLVQEYLEE